MDSSAFQPQAISNTCHICSREVSTKKGFWIEDMLFCNLKCVRIYRHQKEKEEQLRKEKAEAESRRFGAFSLHGGGYL